MPIRRWKRDALVSLKVRDDLFFLGQLLHSPVLCVFRPSRTTDDWRGVTLTPSDMLFSAFVGNVVLNKLVERAVPEKEALPLRGFTQRVWLRPRLNMSGAGGPFRGATLIDIDFDAGQGQLSGTVLKKGLTAADAEVNQYELTNMWGDQDLRERLLYYAEHGIDRDPTKDEVFPPV